MICLQSISQWPAPLIRKWLTLILIGISYLAAGLIMLILSDDAVLLYMSVILALLTIGRCVLLYRKISHGEYQVLEGVCLSTKWIPLQRQRRLCLMTEDEKKFIVSIARKAPLQMGRRYRVYVMASPNQTESEYMQEEVVCYSAFAIEDMGKGCTDSALTGFTVD